MGRKPLLQASVAGALASHIAVGLGLDTGTVILSSIAVMTFVMSVLSCSSIYELTQTMFRSFAIGLGPVPFVMIPEVSPPHVSLMNIKSRILI